MDNPRKRDMILGEVLIAGTSNVAISSPVTGEGAAKTLSVDDRDAKDLLIEITQLLKINNLYLSIITDVELKKEDIEEGGFDDV